MVDRFQQFSAAMSAINQCVLKLQREEMEKYGLKGAHSVYLITMLRYPEGITASQLCEYCAKDKSDVSRMMSIMEKKGLVVKEGVHQNLYKGVFKLTQSGMEAAQFVSRRAKLAVDIAGEELSEEERAIMYSSLETIMNKLRDISRDGLPESAE